MLKLPEITAVFIAIPHHLHFEVAEAALRAGKHVFCEKPLTIETEHSYALAKMAKDAGLVLSCHYNRRQSMHVKMLKSLVNEGVFGDIYHLNIKWMARWTYFMFDTTTTWRTAKKTSGGGILIGRGSHMLDAGWYLLGKPKPKSVYAITHNTLTGYEVDDYANVMLLLENGSTINMECSYVANIAPYAMSVEYQVFGTKAGALCTETDGKFTALLGTTKYPTNEWMDLSEKYDPQSYANNYPISVISDFLDAVRKGREPLVTGMDAAFITQLLQSSYKSSETGEAVKL
jgi:predicted dehydrogenase